MEIKGLIPKANKCCSNAQEQTYHSGATVLPACFVLNSFSPTRTTAYGLTSRPPIKSFASRIDTLRTPGSVGVLGLFMSEETTGTTCSPSVTGWDTWVPEMSGTAFDSGTVPKPKTLGPSSLCPRLKTLATPCRTPLPALMGAVPMAVMVRPAAENVDVLLRVLMMISGWKTILIVIWPLAPRFSEESVKVRSIAMRGSMSSNVIFAIPSDFA